MAMASEDMYTGRNLKPTMPVTTGRAISATEDSRRLIVGRDISLSGEISSCEHLVVDGTVRAHLKGGRKLDVSTTGFFSGKVEIQDCDLSGRFEGELTVSGRLVLRTTGRFSGKLRYGQIEVQPGARMEGDIAPIEAVNSVVDMGSSRVRKDAAQGQ